MYTFTYVLLHIHTHAAEAYNTVFLFLFLFFILLLLLFARVYMWQEGRPHGAEGRIFAAFHHVLHVAESSQRQIGDDNLHKLVK